jgi:hypothetical protein
LALIGVPFTPTILQVLPFLALGLGVDDMFVLASAFHMRKNTGAPVLVAEALKEAGSSVTLTSVCDTRLPRMPCLPCLLLVACLTFLAIVTSLAVVA